MEARVSVVQEIEGHVSIFLKTQGGVRKELWSYFGDSTGNQT